ncbi:mechanosensitive ion channel family protein [Azohydromonas caseinilytica]|uniref:Mechanosensitive ion channel family protein n=1 Tax=Azohydromonas caseinilytica TaxID=2728836 RepID=A0A848F478_9BURK|nr:mechanosensitive ion channel family protein [Azohydromonas caseinilytica]NML14444.1 mechanosensitive ion channel family protein [Azohydromonas caseinilytica]
MPGWLTWEGFTSAKFLGASVTSWATAVAVALASWVAMRLALKLLLGRASVVAQATTNRVDDLLVDLLRGTSRVLLFVTALLIGLSMLELPARWDGRVSQLWFLTLALQFGLWGNRAIVIGLRRYVENHGDGGMARQVSTSATLLSWTLRTMLWAVLLLAMLANLGVNITAMVASLGVGGVAVALAVQNILGDLFASLSIAVDKPFEVGDFITLSGVAGTVEQVGLKTTRIRALSGEQVVISNTELLKQTINNYKRMQQRRVVFKFGLTYDSTPEQAEAVPGIVRRAVESQEHTRFDRAHFQGFGDSSLDFEVVYFVLSSDFNLYMDIQQRINLALMREFRALGVSFAFPTRTLQMPGLEARLAAQPRPEEQPVLRPRRVAP